MPLTPPDAMIGIFVSRANSAVALTLTPDNAPSLEISVKIIAATPQSSNLFTSSTTGTVLISNHPSAAIIPFLASAPTAIRPSNSFAACFNNLGSFNVLHNHPGCDLSGVLWVKCPKECGNIVFYSPSLFETFQEIESYTQDFKDKNNYHHNYFFPPLEGRMLIFPSHLQHEVKKNLSNENRISVSFNIKLEDKK